MASKRRLRRHDAGYRHDGGDYIEEAGRRWHFNALSAGDDARRRGRAMLVDIDAIIYLRASLGFRLPPKS